MRINGEWLECDDGCVRPVVRAEVERADKGWEFAVFLVDTGADCTVLSAVLNDSLGIAGHLAESRLGGVGGTTPASQVSTRLRMPRENGGFATFRGGFLASPELESMDMNVLGRDILDMFALVVDRQADVVAIIGARHGYSIHA